MQFISYSNFAALVGTSIATVKKWAENGTYPSQMENGVTGFFLEDMVSFPEVRELLGKPYWPKDNSYITGLSGETGVDLYHKKCEIVSVPFMDIAGVDDTDKVYPFILVKYKGRYYRTLFREWALIEP